MSARTAIIISIVYKISIKNHLEQYCNTAQGDFQLFCGFLFVNLMLKQMWRGNFVLSLHYVSLDTHRELKNRNSALVRARCFCYSSRKFLYAILTVRLWLIFFARKIKNINRNNIAKIRSFPRNEVSVKSRAAHSSEQTPEIHKYIL